MLKIRDRKRKSNEKNADKDTERMNFKQKMRACWENASMQTIEFKEQSAASFVKWLVVYFMMAFFALLLLNTGGSLNAQSLVVIFTLLPFRMFTLFLFTCPVITLRKPKSAFIFMSSLWFLWHAVAFYRFKLGFAVFFVLLFTSIFVLLAEKPAAVTKYKSLFRKLTAFMFMTLFAVTILQMLQMKSIVKPFSSFLLSPDILACNMVCFAGFGAFVFWVRRPKLSLTCYSLLWAVLAAISFFKSRKTFEPVLFLDVFSFKEGTKAFFVYYKWYVIVGMALLLLLAIIGIVLLILKERKKQFSLISLLCGAAFMLAAFCSVYLMSGLAMMETESKTAKNEYDTKGFVYGFLFYSFDSFVVQPEGYDSTVIEMINKNIEQNYVPYEEDSNVQNVIVIQLESFSDPYDFPGIVLEKDPIPFIRSLMNDYSSGYIGVPVFGGLTVKSEFEFLTGLSIDNVPLGYNPYVQYVYANPMDSMARYFNSEGYTTTAIHNYQGEFFQRNDVYEKLGFDYFIPYEFMPDIEKRAPKIWGNDEVFVNHIEQVLDENGDGKNFIFGVTVQTHGNYEPIPEEEYPMLIRGIEDADTLGSMEYYIQQIQYVDDMVRDLISMLSEREEATYVLFYSDHLPSIFGESHSELTNEQKYSTPYFTWNNMGIEKAEKEERPEDTPNYIPDMELFQLSTFMCDELKIDGSFMNKFHRIYSDTDKYNQEFSSIQYYKMYDEKNDIEFVNETYEMGLYPLEVTRIEPYGEIEGAYIVTGTGFSHDTYFCVNNKLVYPVTLVDPNTVIIDPEELQADDTFTMRIIGEKMGEVLKESETYEWSELVSETP